VLGPKVNLFIQAVEAKHMSVREQRVGYGAMVAEDEDDSFYEHI